jgi:hypothetical protein
MIVTGKLHVGAKRMSNLGVAQHGGVLNFYTNHLPVLCSVGKATTEKVGRPSPQLSCNEN